MNWGIGLNLFLRELDIRIGNGGTGRNKDPGKPQTYRLYTTIIHKLQVAAAEVHSPRGRRVTLFDTILRVLDSALPDCAKYNICTGQSQYQNKGD